MYSLFIAHTTCVIFASLYLDKEENIFFAVFLLSLSLLFIKEKKDKKTAFLLPLSFLYL